ncbi:MAG: Zinc-binding dehydrogenase, partial [Kribbellaceae bacterium]|nr:Zinc-binding dehydrogenase [Kribbellaceae bacterium]
ADGVLRLNVAQTFPLADAAKAQELSEAGHTAGKFVVIP